jgi:hypothetical protein
MIFRRKAGTPDLVRLSELPKLDSVTLKVGIQITLNICSPAIKVTVGALKNGDMSMSMKGLFFHIVTRFYV